MSSSFIPRRLPEHLKVLGSFFPVVSITGPRQAGKTTLLKETYPDYRYVSLENPSVRLAIQEDPEGFLATYNDRVIFDEAQRYPDLFSYLQGVVDERRTPARFILSGSQNFLLRKSITQSLAGRVGIARLFPLDNTELKHAGKLPLEYEEALFQGGYPELVSKKVPPAIFYSSYLASYVERDVAEFVSPANLDIFQRFIRICAIYSGQTINYSKIANDTGVSLPTIQSWLAILEQSYIIFRLPPFFRNFGKRLTKTPKLYFYDTGLLSFLFGLKDPADVAGSDFKGALFENAMVADAIKSFHHMGEEPRFYYYRDKSKDEVDLVYERASLARLWEIKAAYSFRPRLIEKIEAVASNWDRPTDINLLYTGDEEHRVRKTNLINWRNVEWKP